MKRLILIVCLLLAGCTRPPVKFREGEVVLLHDGSKGQIYCSDNGGLGKINFYWVRVPYTFELQRFKEYELRKLGEIER